MIYFELIFKLILCHLLGDYVLQVDYLAKTKGDNFYHLLAHCFLYAVPFYICFGFVWQLIPLISLHIIIDLLKAKKIHIFIYPKGNQKQIYVMPYWLDQLLHYLTCLLYLIY